MPHPTLAAAPLHLSRANWGVPLALAAGIVASCCSVSLLEAQVFFATSFFAPAVDDPNPELSALIRVDATAGTAESFAPLGAVNGRLAFPQDVAVGPHDGHVYVATLLGDVLAFDGVSGAPLPSPIPGGDDGLYVSFAGDGVVGLLFDNDGTLYASRASGAIGEVDPSGSQLADVATGLISPGTMTFAPDGSIFVGTGEVGTPSSIERIDLDDGTITTIVPPGSFGDPNTIIGATGLAFLAPKGDYDRDGDVTLEDRAAWSTEYGVVEGVAADGNGDGIVSSADYTVWRDDLGSSEALYVTDFFSNRLVKLDSDGSNLQTLNLVPPTIPDPLPDGVDPQAASNFPSELILSNNDTLYGSNLGLTRRPDNRGAIYEYDLNGQVVGAVFEGLPPLSGIALAATGGFGASSGKSIPEPHSLSLLLLCGILAGGGRSRFCRYLTDRR